MIVLGNSEFAIGMKFIGLKDSHVIRDKEQCLKIIKDLPEDEFILANVSVINMVPKLKEFSNLVSIPDDPNDFKSTDDLNYIIKSAIGFELNK
jgi:vacuolar-type H+-ATPase subunit F/Vma7